MLATIGTLLDGNEVQFVREFQMSAEVASMRKAHL